MENWKIYWEGEPKNAKAYIKTLTTNCSSLCGLSALACEEELGNFLSWGGCWGLYAFRYLWAIIGQTYNKKSGGRIPSCWFNPKVFWINCLKQLGNLIKYNSGTVTFLCLGGDCWLGAGIALHMPTTYNIAIGTREISCHVLGLNMEKAMWPGHKLSISENKKYAQEIYSITT